MEKLKARCAKIWKDVLTKFSDIRRFFATPNLIGNACVPREYKISLKTENLEYPKILTNIARGPFSEKIKNWCILEENIIKSIDSYSCFQKNVIVH